MEYWTQSTDGCGDSMTNDTVINGKEVELEGVEKTEAEKFHKEQIAFAMIPDGNGKNMQYELVFNEDSTDDRDHMHWLMDDYGITLEVFEGLVRGYIKPGRI